MAAGPIRKAFDAGVKANDAVTDADRGLVQAGRAIADQLDYAKAHLTGPELQKALYLTPHLVNVQRELLATPLSRNTINSKKRDKREDDTGGSLAAVRGIRGASEPKRTGKVA